MRDQPTDIAAFRAALRREKIAARQALPEKVHRQASVQVRAHLAALIARQPVGSIGFCWPIRAEVDCQPLVLDLLTAGWRAVMPVVTATHAPMQFRNWSPTAPMTHDPYGIPIPETLAGQPPCPPPNVLLLPLVACDAAGYRLGYGGGYFDRTLAACVARPLTIGVGFALSGVATIYPEPHDIPLDWIVTENGPHPTGRRPDS